MAVRSEPYMQAKQIFAVLGLKRPCTHHIQILIYFWRQTTFEFIWLLTIQNSPKDKIATVLNYNVAPWCTGRIIPHFPNDKSLVKHKKLFGILSCRLKIFWGLSSKDWCLKEDNFLSGTNYRGSGSISFRNGHSHYTWVRDTSMKINLPLLLDVFR